MRLPPEHSTILRRAYDGRRVCITGGAGFIGSHLVEALIAQGAVVAVIDDLSSSDASRLAPLIEQRPDRLRFVHGSILEPAALADAAADATLVFHLAALTSVAASMDEPERTFDVNAAGTVRVAEAALLEGADRLIYSASSSAYGDTPVPHRESQRPQPLSPYAASKLAGEHVVTAWSRSRGLPGISLRLFNVFGPRQRAGDSYAAVIPSFCQRIRAGQPPIIYGDGRQSRDFIHVSNAVLGFLLAGAVDFPDRGPRGDVVNIGAGRAVTILELAELLAHQLGRDDLPPVHEKPRAGDVRQSLADVSVAQQLLGYRPIVTLEDGLAELVANCAGASSTGA